MGINAHAFLAHKKRAVLWLAVFIVILTVLFFTAERALRQKELEVRPIASATGTSSSSQAWLLKDSGHNGLKNWEWILQQTASASQTIGTKTSSSDASNDGVTTALGKAITESGTLEQAATGQSTELPAQYLSDVKGSYAAARETFVSQGYSRLRYSQATDDQSIKNYFNAVAALFIKNLSNLSSTDFEIIQQIAANPDDASKTALLDPYVVAMQNVWDSYAKLVAPLAAKQFHSQAADLIRGSLFELTALRNIDQDPAMALLALQDRLRTKIALTQLYDIDVRQWLENKGIQFSASEPAHQLFGW